MPHAPIRILLEHLQRNRAAPRTAGADDAELLGRFIRDRDEAAFELLVWRHGSLVYSVCRRVLGDAHAAEDAFQATFLVLVRKAASVSRRQALAGWLYRVAYRVALRARARTIPQPMAELPEPPAEEPDAALWRDLRPVLDEEVGRLPQKYRLPVVLCYLSGLTTDEAARQLGVPRGTVLSRLAWARQRLRARLSLRGVTLSAGVLGALLASRAAGSASAAVVGAAFRAALAFAAGQPTAASVGAVTLMEGAIRDMVMSRIRSGMLVVLGLTVVGLGLGLWATRPATAEQVERRREEPRPQTPADAPAVMEEVRAPEAPRPIGVWERTLPTKEGISLTLTLRIDAHRVSLTQTTTGGGKAVKATLEGDYSVSRDYVLYGFVTAVDVAEGVDADEAGKMQAQILDQPFAVRYRMDANSLTIRDIKLGGVPDKERDGLQVLAGRYKKKAPAAKDEVPTQGNGTNSN
jgi:RNA polymerase sigma factor (sigma-70 family)